MIHTECYFNPWSEDSLWHTIGSRVPLITNKPEGKMRKNKGRDRSKGSLYRPGEQRSVDETRLSKF